MKEDSENEAKVESLVKRSMTTKESGLVVPNFQQSWLQAKQVQTDNGLSQSSLASFANRLLPAGLITAIVSATLIISFHFSRSMDEEKLPLTEQVFSDKKTELVVDAKHVWRSPTDELLSIDVREYETRYVKFIRYNPITMEILQ
ncbi:MAG: hypothetical protein GKR93_02525 [Gammaproteobacteria bacterium]|nr:hypothetical protein [Gammaproteobacteria bacterium]